MKKTEKLLSQFSFIRVVRSGLLMLIPVLTVGSLALILRSLPIPFYQSFINSFGSGIIYTLFSLIYNSTFGLLSVYMVICLSYCYGREHSSEDGMAGTVFAGITAFLISVGFLTEAFEQSSFSAVGMFTAIICGTVAPALYLHIRHRIPQRGFFFDGSEPLFNRAIASILPLAVSSLICAGINIAVDTLFGVGNFWQLFSNAVNALFSVVGLNFFGGLLYILLSSVMWFFGIHGSDVLESVNAHLFEPAMARNIEMAVPGEIFTKTFFDVFVLMGGCGCALSLLVAILLFSRRRSSRSLAKMAAFPMLFNINELMVFGLPIVYNPIMLVPFIAAPVACFLISSLAMYLGLVPLTTVAVEWTTPILLGGYRATGSISGALLQLLNLVIGTIIYMPFVRRYDREKERENLASVDLLVATQKENEAQNRSVLLTCEGGIVGSLAKQLVNDLSAALSDGGLSMVYQPQCDGSGGFVGCEALLRWKHPSLGYIYPPLVIKLASEGGFLTRLEKAVFLLVREDAVRYGFSGSVSVNITVPTLREAELTDFLMTEFPDAKVGSAYLTVEITEQSELSTDNGMKELLGNLRSRGFRLAIDDFSMGYTSLKYLQECHFDEVKLDGSLVRGMSSGTTRNIISSIVYLSESLGFTVLAEFVETEEQKNQLADIGVHRYQGYLFSPGLPPSELKTFSALRGAELKS